MLGLGPISSLKGVQSGGAGAIVAAAVTDTAGKLVKLLKSGGLVGGLACGALVGFALGKAR